MKRAAVIIVLFLHVWWSSYCFLTGSSPFSSVSLIGWGQIRRGVTIQPTLDDDWADKRSVCVSAARQHDHHALVLFCLVSYVRRKWGRGWTCWFKEASSSSALTPGGGPAPSCSHCRRRRKDQDRSLSPHLLQGAMESSKSRGLWGRGRSFHLNLRRIKVEKKKLDFEFCSFTCFT